MLPDDLAKLKEQVAVLTKKISLGGLLDFADGLRAAAYKYRDSTDIEVVESLTDLWMYRFESIMKYSRQHCIPSDEIDTFMHMLVHTGRIETIRENEQYTRSFARVCLMQLMENTDADDTENPTGGNLENVLSLWFRKPVPMPSSLEAGFNLFYGPACWALYLNDVKSEKKLPALAWALQVPVIGAQPRNFFPAIPADLA